MVFVLSPTIISSGIGVVKPLGRILLDFVKGAFPELEDCMREQLILDYYLRENAKARPDFAGEYLVSGDVLREFYGREAWAHEYLPDYEGYDRHQMRRMTHLEYFPTVKKMLLFDYMCRNPLNHEARTCIIKIGLLDGNHI